MPVNSRQSVSNGEQCGNGNTQTSGTTLVNAQIAEVGFGTRELYRARDRDLKAGRKVKWGRLSMPYNTVFEITQKPYEWRYSAFGLIFVTIGVVFIVWGPQLDRLTARKWTGLSFWLKPRFAFKPQYLGWFFVIFASFWTLLAFASTYSSYRN